MDSELAKTIGPGLRRARYKTGMTQEQVAEVIGVSTEFYARIERSHALPSVETLSKICYQLDVSADFLLYGDSQQVTESLSHEPSTDSPELRRLIRILRRAEPPVLRLVTHLLATLRKAQKESLFR